MVKMIFKLKVNLFQHMMIDIEYFDFADFYKISEQAYR